MPETAFANLCGLVLHVGLTALVGVILLIHARGIGRRVSRLEHLLDALNRRPEYDLNNPEFLSHVLALHKVRDLLREGKKDEAIETYSVEKEVSLATARAVVERVEKQNGVSVEGKRAADENIRAGAPPRA